MIQMTHINYKKRVLFLFVISFIISISAGIIMNNLIAYENYKNMSSFINTLLSYNSELDNQEVFLSLKETYENSSRDNVSIDFSLMEKYGYTYKAFLDFTNQKIMMISIICFLCVFLIFTSLCFFNEKEI